MFQFGGGGGYIACGPIFEKMRVASDDGGYY